MKNTHSAAAAPTRFRRRLISAALAIGVMSGAVAWTAMPAQAALLVSTCFARASSSINVHGLPVALNAYLGPSSSVTIATTALDGAGCATFVVPPGWQNHYLWTSIDTKPYGNYHWGTSYYYAAPGYGVSILWGTVYCQGCR